jgi:uncharacterized damage-inducible protein DinB
MDSNELFARWMDVRSGLYEALVKIKDEQLDFRPREGLWSIRETAVHIAGTEDGWLRYYTLNRWHENPPNAKDYPTIDSIKSLLSENHDATIRQFAHNVDALLHQNCTLPWGGHVSMEWAVWHVLEHEIHHRGEIYLMLGLLGIEAPDV